MTTEIKVPVLPESVADATIATWHVQVGDKVSRDQVLVDIETDKVVLEVPATSDGVITDISQAEGATVLGEQVIAILSEGESEAAAGFASVAPSSLLPVGAVLALSPSVRIAITCSPKTVAPSACDISVITPSDNACTSKTTLSVSISTNT